MSRETVESPVTAVSELSIEGSTVLVASQWNSTIRMWTVSRQGFLTPCGSRYGQVHFWTCPACLDTETGCYYFSLFITGVLACIKGPALLPLRVWWWIEKWWDQAGIGWSQCLEFLSVLWCFGLGDRQGIRPVKRPFHLSPKLLFQNKWRRNEREPNFTWKTSVKTELFYIHRVRKKEATLLLPLTLPYANRFLGDRL